MPVSDNFKKWIEFTKSKESLTIKPLTNTQSNFAEFLLDDKNIKTISSIGDMESIFKSIRNYLKSN